MRPEQSDDADSEYLLEASVVLKNPEEGWLNKDCLILLRRKMKNSAISKYSRKKEKKEKWEKIFS